LYLVEHIVKYMFLPELILINHIYTYCTSTQKYFSKYIYKKFYIRHKSPFKWTTTQTHHLLGIKKNSLIQRKIRNYWNKKI